MVDGQEANEIFLTLQSQDVRETLDAQEIVLRPGEQRKVTLDFPKFYDNEDDAQSLTFGAVRVMEKYSGTEVEEAIIQSEIQNAVAKFSVNIPMK